MSNAQIPPTKREVLDSILNHLRDVLPPCTTVAVTRPTRYSPEYQAHINACEDTLIDLAIILQNLGIASRGRYLALLFGNKRNLLERLDMMYGLDDPYPEYHPSILTHSPLIGENDEVE